MANIPSKNSDGCAVLLMGAIWLAEFLVFYAIIQAIIH